MNIGIERISLRVLVVDPEPGEGTVVRASLVRSGVPMVLETAVSTSGALSAISAREFDIILSDHRPPVVNAIRLLQALQKREIEIPLILVSHRGELQTAREAFRWGAGDFLLKEELEAVSLIDIICSVLEKSHRQRDSEAWNRTLQERANRDGLTQLHNHRYFVESLEKEFLRSRRYGNSLSLIMLDLDGFKTINDHCGHQTGDQILIRIASILTKSVRGVDLVARYGGDEFVILLPETDGPSAYKIALRLKDQFRRSPFLDGGKIYPLSASIGVSSISGTLTSAGQLLREADKALYQAKKAGRDCVVNGALLTHPMYSKASNITS